MQKFTFLILFGIIFFSFPTSAQTATDDFKFILETENPIPQSGNYFTTERAFLSFSDNYSEGYVLRSPQGGEEDNVTYNVGGTPLRQVGLWTLLDGSAEKLLSNGLPMKDNRVVRIGFSSLTDAYCTLTVEINATRDIRSLALVDRVTNDTINLLLQQSYRFYTLAITNNTSRFLLLVNTSSIPMLVGSDVRISSALRSEGPVHVYVGNNAGIGKIDIDNTDAKAALVTDTIIFYSNDTVDGLLRNQNTDPTGGVKGLSTENPRQVILRKNLTSNVWTFFSLPFKASADIYQNGVLFEDYGVFEFDAKNRSDKSSTAPNVVWKQIDYTGFAKAKGYQIKVRNSGGNFDFISSDPSDIDTLFSTSKHKPIVYPSYGAPAGTWSQPVGDGWAFIGGLHSTTHKISADAIRGYGGTIYYRMAGTSQEVGMVSYGEVRIGSGENTTIGPYTPFYIQGTSTPGNTDWNNFTFHTDGVADHSLESVGYRSADYENAIKDQLYFGLSSDKDNSYDRLYLAFDRDYVESFRAVEDAIKMSTAYEDKPAVWNLMDETNIALFVNGLPMKDEREVKIGFSVPEAGNYTFSVRALHRQDVRNAILVDNVTGKKVNLLEHPYSFNTESVKENNSRFKLFINSSYTDIPVINSSDPYAYVKDNLLTIKNLSEENTVQILDLSGRTIVSGKISGNEFSTILSQRGVYVVNVKGEKTTVLKVLNK